MTDDPDVLARLVHDQRLAHEADRAAEEGRAHFLVGSWEERPPHMQELDRRIASAVAAAARNRVGLDKLINRATWAEMRLAAIRDLCREKPDRVCAEDVLRIIGDEEGTTP